MHIFLINLSTKSLRKQKLSDETRQKSRELQELFENLMILGTVLKLKSLELKPTILIATSWPVMTDLARYTCAKPPRPRSSKT